MAAWAYQSTGSIVTSSTGLSLSPGAPAGLTSGDLELLYTGQRTAGAAGPGTITGWTKLYSTGYSNPALDLWGRFSTGGADDTPTVDWDGVNMAFAWIERRTGGGYADLATIVAHSAMDVGNNGSLVLRLPAFTPATVDNCTVIGLASRNNTAIDATAITHSQLTVRSQYLATAASRLHAACGDLQQTTAADYDGTDFVIDGTSENLGTRGIIVYLRTADAATARLANYYRMLRGL